MAVKSFITLAPSFIYFADFFSDLYYKHITIVNYDSRVINELETSLTDDARVVNYNRHMFIVQATGLD
jgi:hypothetical protein